MKIKLPLACVLIVSASYCGAQTSAPSKSSSQPSMAAKATGTASIDPQKEADIRRLMTLTGSAGIGMQLMKNMETSMKPLLENSLPPGAYRQRLIELFFEKFHALGTEESITAIVVPIYDRYFSDQDLKGLIAFYQSPLGKKTIAVMPRVVAESQEAGRQWGEELGKQSMEEVLAEHPDLKKELEDAKRSSSY